MTTRADQYTIQASQTEAEAEVPSHVFVELFGQDGQEAIERRYELMRSGALPWCRPRVSFHCMVCQQTTYSSRPRWCGGCRVLSFCSARCQRASWRDGHHAQCASLARSWRNMKRCLQEEYRVRRRMDVYIQQHLEGLHSPDSPDSWGRQAVRLLNTRKQLCYVKETIKARWKREWGTSQPCLHQRLHSLTLERWYFYYWKHWSHYVAHTEFGTCGCLPESMFDPEEASWTHMYWWSTEMQAYQLARRGQAVKWGTRDGPHRCFLYDREENPEADYTIHLPLVRPHTARDSRATSPTLVHST